jgi:carbon monoxide dehydrogenase subunit G
VDAPAGVVWDFLVDPRRVVACVPGGELGQVVDERTFHGKVRVRVGPLVLAYRGRVSLAEVDAGARRVRIVGEARETAGTDAVRMTLESGLTALPTGGTEVIARVRVEVEGRLIELGRGVLERAGHEVFRDFAACVRARIEAEAAGGSGGGAGARAPVPHRDALRPVPLLIGALRAWVAELLRARGARRR